MRRERVTAADDVILVDVEMQRRLDAFVALTSIAEPDADDLLVEPERRGDASDVVGGRLRMSMKMILERVLRPQADRRATLSTPIQSAFDNTRAHTGGKIDDDVRIN